MLGEIKTHNFLEIDKTSQGINKGTGMIKNNDESAARATVDAVNELQDQLGFTLSMTSRPSGHEGHIIVDLLTSQPIHSDFFTPSGVFWSTMRSVGTGDNIVGKVLAPDVKTILIAEMAGINTFQIIANELQHPSNPEKIARWQTIMAGMQSL